MASAERFEAVQSAKRALRREVLARLRALTPEARRRDSAAILERLFALESFRRARGVHAYLSLDTEVDTAPLLARCRDEGKPVFVPYQLPAQEPGEARLGIARWSPEMPLVAGPLGVREPAPAARGGGPDAELARYAGAIELVIVPGVAFDRAGRRLGHGKGYYDRFLAELDAARARLSLPPAHRVALLFPVQWVDAVPVADWDARMQALVLPDSERACG